MRKLSLFLLFFLIISCSSNKTVYWCGDHACINKKEKEAYFKKTMIVEIRDLSLKNSTENSENMEKIIKDAQIKEKTRVVNEKKLKKEEKLKHKALKKKEKQEKKKRIKMEKELAKQAKLDKKKLKIEKSKKKENFKKLELSKSNITVKANSFKFKNILKEINERNMLKPYPDINNLPN